MPQGQQRLSPTTARKLQSYGLDPSKYTYESEGINAAVEFQRGKTPQEIASATKTAVDSLGNQTSSNTGTPSPENFPEFRAVFNKERGEEGFNAKFDYDFNDVIDFQDFIKYAEQDGEGLSDDQVNLLNRFPEFKATFGTKKGEEGYRATFDLNSDNLVDFNDFIAFAGGQREPKYEGPNVWGARDFVDANGDGYDDRTSKNRIGNNKSDDVFLEQYRGFTGGGMPSADTTRIKTIAKARGIDKQTGPAELLAMMGYGPEAGQEGSGQDDSGPTTTTRERVVDAGDGRVVIYTDTFDADGNLIKTTQRIERGGGFVDVDGDGFDDNTGLDRQGNPRPAAGSTDTFVDADGDGYDDNTGLDRQGNPRPAAGSTDTFVDADGDGFDDNTGLNRQGNPKPDPISQLLGQYSDQVVANIDPENVTDDDVRDVFQAERNPLEQKATTLGLGLGFDVDKQIEDSDTEIDLLFDEQKEAVARAYAIRPSAARSGAAQRGLEHLERDRALAKAQARQRIRTQAGGEERANIETISNFLTAREQKDVTDAQLKLAEDAQAHGFMMDEARLTGIIQKAGPGSLADFTAAYNATSEQENYNPDFDFNVDGVIDFDDWLEYQAAVENSQVQTLEGKRLQADLANQQFERTVVRAGLTGTFEGAQTVANKQRLWQNKFEETQLFGGPPPVTYTQEELQDSLGSKRGEVNYRAEWDSDKDGEIDLDDFSAIAARTEDLGDGVLMYTPPGRQTLAARELGLDEKKYVEASRQFNASISVRRSEFMQTLSGMVFETNEDGSLKLDEDGNPVGFLVEDGTDEHGEPVYRQATALERDKYNTAKDQFDKELKQAWDIFIKELDFNEKKLEEMIKAGNYAALVAGLSGIGEAIATEVFSGGIGNLVSGASSAGTITLGGLVANAALPAALFTAQMGVVHFLNRFFDMGPSQASTAVASTILDPSTVDPAVMDEILTAVEENADIFNIGRPVSKEEILNGSVAIPDSLLRDIVSENVPEGMSFEDAIGNSERLGLGSGTNVGFTQKKNADGTIGVGAPEGTPLDELKQINVLQAHQVGLKPDIFNKIVEPMIGSDPARAREFNTDPNKFLAARGWKIVSGAVTKL